MATTKPEKAKKRQLRIVCLLLPLAMLLPKGIDAFLHCDRTVDFFAADLAASVALLLAGFLLLTADRIYSNHGPQGDAPSKRRAAYIIFQITMALAIFATGIFCFVGNAKSAISNGGAAEATTSDAVQRSPKDSWRMDPFNVCKSNNQTRIVELHSQQPEVFRSIQRNAALLEWFIALTWAAVTCRLAWAYIQLWKMTCDELNRQTTNDDDVESGCQQNENEDNAINYFNMPRGNFICCNCCSKCCDTCCTGCLMCLLAPFACCFSKK